VFVGVGVSLGVGVSVAVDVCRSWRVVGVRCSWRAYRPASACPRRRRECVGVAEVFVGVGVSLGVSVSVTVAVSVGGSTESLCPTASV
jgi:hypothetical protein